MIGNPTPWWSLAKCKGQDTDDFFFIESRAKRDQPRDIARARALCDGCPVIAECLTDALSQGVERQQGVAVATTANERLRLFAVVRKTSKRAA